MAEFLVKAVDAVNLNIEKNRQCYKRGDIVVVKPDGWAWGKKEGPPRFEIVKIPGMSYMTALPYASEGRKVDALPGLRRKYRMSLDGSKTITNKEIE